MSEKQNLKLSAWIPECEKPEDDLNIIMDIEIADETHQAGFSLERLFDMKLAAGLNYIKSNNSFISDVTETLQYDINNLLKILIKMEGRLEQLKLANIIDFSFNKNFNDYDEDTYNEIITMFHDFLFFTEINENTIRACYWCEYDIVNNCQDFQYIDGVEVTATEVQSSLYYVNSNEDGTYELVKRVNPETKGE